MASYRAAATVFGRVGAQSVLRLFRKKGKHHGWRARWQLINVDGDIGVVKSL